ncbi:MAG: hypothetical protein ACOC9P_01480 [bacterium]
MCKRLHGQPDHIRKGDPCYEGVHKRLAVELAHWVQNVERVLTF